MTTFALLHGGSHGGWCWERVVPLLQRDGHRTVSPDLHFDDPSRGARDAAQLVVDALADADDDVVVVGHSFGGMVVPLVAAARPVRRMVFLGAMVPMPGMTYVDYLATADGAGAITMPMDRLGYDELGRAVVPPEVAREVFYPDCPAEDFEAAVARLVPNAATLFTEPATLDRWPDVPSTYIRMTEDLTVGGEWAERVARKRLGADLVELPGSHSPFYSRPAELAEILARL
jgi:pimeloyl-ACP methyl ester carboxylesterase